MSTTRRNRRAKKSSVVGYISLATILTSCIVFALLLNINSNQSRKAKLSAVEALVVQKEAELEDAKELAEYRERCANQNLAKAEAMMKKYEDSLSEAVSAQHQSKLLIEKYEQLNQDLTENLAKTNALGEEREKQLSEVKQLRERTVDMRNSVLNFYNKTKKDQQLAKDEIAKSQSAYNTSVERMRLANQMKQQAEVAIVQNHRYAATVDRLEDDLSDSYQENAALQNHVSQANQHIYYHHTKEQHQVHKQPKKRAPIVKRFPSGEIPKKDPPFHPKPQPNPRLPRK